jgi:hypothetical protein
VHVPDSKAQVPKVDPRLLVKVTVPLGLVATPPSVSATVTRQEAENPGGSFAGQEIVV